jgi:hypothetical protein
MQEVRGSNPLSSTAQNNISNSCTLTILVPGSKPGWKGSPKSRSGHRSSQALGRLSGDRAAWLGLCGWHAGWRGYQARPGALTCRRRLVDPWVPQPAMADAGIAQEWSAPGCDLDLMQREQAYVPRRPGFWHGSSRSSDTYRRSWPQEVALKFPPRGASRKQPSDLPVLRDRLA